MITLSGLADLAVAYPDALAAPVGEVRIAGRTRDLDRNPLVMGVVNLSRDSTYRDSVAVSTASALRRARMMHAAGAELIDVGAESTTVRAARVGAAEQVGALVPVIEELSAAGIPTSVEAYSAQVVRACLAAGASVVNLTGSRELEEIHGLAAAHDAAVVLCFVPGADVRQVRDAGANTDPFPMLHDYFAERIAQARAAGVTQLVIDPGLGFYYADLIDPLVRARHQARVLLESFRLRALGVPICQALPHAFDIFEEEFRVAEAFFAVLARLGGVHVLRTHEVARVRAVLHALEVLP